ncbi:MAG: MFS transporter [Acidimicrobiia bacterium]
MRDYLERLRATGGLVEPGVLAVAVLVLTAIGFFRVALLPEFGRDLSMSTFQLGAVTTVFAVGRLAADLPGGHLADRFPARGILAVSAGTVAVASLMFGLSVTLLPLYAAALMVGMASATTNGTGMTYFSNVGGTDSRGTSMAIFSAALLGGQAFGPAAAGLMAAAWDWRVAMFIAAAAAAALSLWLAFSTGGGRSTIGPKASAEDDRSGATGPRLGSMLVLQSVSFAMFLTLGAVPNTLVPIVGSDVLGLGAAAIGLALGLGGLSRFIGTLVGGRMSDRMSRKSALVPGLLVQAAGVSLLAFPPSLVLWLSAIVVMSVASFAVPVAATIVGDLSDPSRVGSQLGRFRFVGDLGLVAGPVTVGAIYDGVGREAAFLTVAGLLTVVALVALKLLPETGSVE